MRRFIITCIGLSCCLAAWGADRSAAWQAVEKAVAEGLPKTAIEHLDTIIQSALQDQASAEVAKAVAEKIVLEGNIQGNKPEEKIVRLEAAIGDLPAATWTSICPRKSAW